jgi:hypothetical protein
MLDCGQDHEDASYAEMIVPMNRSWLPLSEDTSILLFQSQNLIEKIISKLQFECIWQNQTLTMGGCEIVLYDKFNDQRLLGSTECIRLQHPQLHDSISSQNELQTEERNKV